MQYDSVFYDFGDICPELSPEPATDEMVEAAEARLGVRLPRDYVNLLKHQNGGLLVKRFSRTVIIDGEPNPIGVIQIYGIGGENGLDAVVNGKTVNQILIENWDYPERSVVFSPCGAAGCAFDYDDLDADGEPSILYRYCDCLKPVTHIRVFRNFRQFLDSLEQTLQSDDLRNEPQNQL